MLGVTHPPDPQLQSRSRSQISSMSKIIFNFGNSHSSVCAALVKVVQVYAQYHCTKFQWPCWLVCCLCCVFPAMRKAACGNYRHTFLQAASGAMTAYYAPTIPRRLDLRGNQEDDGADIVGTVYAFPITFGLAPDGGTSDETTKSPGTSVGNEGKPSARCLVSGNAYVYYKPSVQLHCHPSVALLLHICSSHIECSEVSLKRQVQQVEARLLAASSPDLIVDAKI